MEEKQVVISDGLKLAAVLHRPDGVTGPCPAFIVLHGFGGNKDTLGGIHSAELMEKLGYAALRIDFRGCGESEGPRGRTICLEQVDDLINAVTHLTKTAGIDPKRIGVIGHSSGASVAVYGAAVDERIAACIAVGGYGDGAAKFRKQHASPEAWRTFIDMMRDGSRRQTQGETVMVPRFNIVPMPKALRENIPTDSSIMEFPFDVVESVFNFRPIDVIERIAPRPLLLMHAASDSVTPTEGSIEMFRHARQPADLYLMSGVDHFGVEVPNEQLTAFLKTWLDKHFPSVTQ
jgi:pimeloyl-ACP methyl ester carboxylesterase